MSEQPTYPYGDGDVTVLGPQIFASKDGAVISWRGDNYVPQSAPACPDPIECGHEAALGQAEAAIERVRRLADLIEAGAPWTRNAGELAGRIRDAIDGMGETSHG